MEQCQNHHAQKVERGLNVDWAFKFLGASNPEKASLIKLGLIEVVESDVSVSRGVH
jgi:hypothetical protein